MLKIHNFMFNNKIIFTFLIIILLITTSFFSVSRLNADNKVIKKDVINFAIISDPHVLANINDFENNNIYLKYGIGDEKLLKYSETILVQVINKIIAMGNIDFVVITGDLTDIGDKESHICVKNILNKLIINGIKIFIIPGNHDGFHDGVGELPEAPADLITKGQFTSLYSNCGYEQAIYKDPNSLSYVVEPTKNLWLIMIDSCIYSSNESYHVCNGRIKDKTREWILNILKEAQAKNKLTLGFMHHGILEHYSSQQKYFGRYLVDDWENLSEIFAQNKLNIIFTGHNHAQDIVLQRFKDNKSDNETFLYDIETSSLISYPNTYRVVKLKDYKELEIKSISVKEIAGFKGDFHDYSKQYTEDIMFQLSSKKLKSYFVFGEANKNISRQVAEGFIEHYKGDEISIDNLKIKNLGLWSNFIYGFYEELVYDLFYDKKPKDNNIKIDLKTSN